MRRSIIGIALAILLAAPLLVAQDPTPAPKPPVVEPKPLEPKPQEPKPQEPKKEPGQEPAPPTGEKPAPPAESAVDPAIAMVREFIAKRSTGESPSIDKKQPSWRTSVPKFPTLTFTAGKSYFWDLETSHGKIRIRFMPDIAPQHVANFVYLSELGFFDGLTFHRVIPGFMAQGGCPLGSGSGGPAYRFGGEFPKGENGQLKVKHDRPGLLSMANTPAPETDGSQFFITFGPTPHLDGKHTVFGEVVQGMEVARELEKRGSPGGRTSEPLKMVKATIAVE